jgi:3-dehydroquinate dehydratase-2
MEKRMANKILVVNGPNLNLLGTREPDRYGHVTLASVEQELVRRARQAGAQLTCFQSNSETDVLCRIQQAGPEGVEFILINPAAYTHTSVAIRDALAAVNIPFIEIHLTNIYAREPFRQRSFFSDLAVGVVSGLGEQGYQLALAYALEHGRKD